MINKNLKRSRRFAKARGVIRRLNANHLCVHRTSQHIYAQVLSPCGSKVLAQASTLDKDLRAELTYGGNKSAAARVGKLIAERCIAAGINKVAFDRSGFKYHGRIKELADAARAGGVEF
jgi:large subunit ribosomal protein L18